MDFVGKRYWYFLASLLVIAPGVVFLIIGPGLKPGIDFTGGSTLKLEFSDEVEQGDIRAELTELGHPEAIVQKLGDDLHFIRTKTLTEEDKVAILGRLEATISPSGVAERGFDFVSPVVARETVLNAFWAVLAASVGIFLYLWWAFRNVPSPFRYGIAAIIALVHDTLVVVGIFAALGVLFDVEVNTMFLIAVLTVIGYSVNDTIVVFDRLRENILLNPNSSLEANANLSISETIGRSVNTSLTLLFTLLALVLFGGPTIRGFLWVLLIGVVAGTYSSIAVAAQALIVWEKGDVGRLWRRAFGRRPSPAR